MFRAVKWFTVLVVFLISVLIFGRVLVVEQLLPFLLEKRGIIVEQFIVNELGLSTVKVSKLRISTGLYVLTLNDLVLNYHIKDFDTLKATQGQSAQGTFKYFFKDKGEGGLTKNVSTDFEVKQLSLTIGEQGLQFVSGSFDFHLGLEPWFKRVSSKVQINIERNLENLKGSAFFGDNITFEKVTLGGLQSKGLTGKIKNPFNFAYDLNGFSCSEVATTLKSSSLAWNGQTLPLRNLDLGIRFKDIFNQPSNFKFTKARAEAFGGKLSLGNVPLSFSTGNVTYLVDLDRVNLAELMQYYPVSGLEVTGLIQGRLPVKHSKNGLSVTNGELRSLALGGIIKYDSRSGASGTSQSPLGVDFVMKVLSNYHYTSFLSGVKYKEDGNLTLDTQFMGRNPDLNNGQAVNVNLKIEENVPSLLKSISIQQKIEQKLRQHK